MLFLLLLGMLAFNGSPSSSYLPPSVTPVGHAAMYGHQSMMMSPHPTGPGHHLAGYASSGGMSGTLAAGQSPLHDGLGHIQDVHAG